MDPAEKCIIMANFMVMGQTVAETWVEVHESYHIIFVHKFHVHKFLHAFFFHKTFLLMKNCKKCV